MKVVYIERKPDLYGSGLSLLSLLDYVVLHGVEPLVIVIRKGQLTEELDKRKIPYVTLFYFFNCWPLHKNVKDYIFLFPKIIIYQLVNVLAVIKLMKIVRRFKADIVHTNIGPTQVGYWASRFLNIKHVWHLREYDFGWSIFPQKSNMIKKLNNSNNYTISITNDIKEYYSVDNSKVIADAVFDKSSFIFDMQKENYFLYVGRLAELKGVRSLFIAFHEFSKKCKDYRLLIVGDVDDLSFKNELINIAKDEYDNNRIDFLGYRDDICQLMSKAKALISPCAMEGLGRVTIEAMFSGCLVIGKNAGGTKEILSAKDLGLLYDTNDDLVKLLEYVSNNGIHVFENKLRQAQKEAIKKYSIEASGMSVLEYYNSIINSK